MNCRILLAMGLLAAALAVGPLCGCRSATTHNYAVTPASASLPLSAPPSSVAAAKPPLMAAYPWEPSHYRKWKRDLAVLPRADFDGERVTIRNIRDADYITENDFLLRYNDRTYDLDDLESIYFFVVPFTEAPALAHTMLSFGFADGRHLGVSVEVRLEEGETYSPLLGAMRQFEIMYVVAEERDLVLLRTETRDCDVYMYKARTTPEQTRAFFVDVMRRVNEIHQQPEFYDTLVNNCTTNIVDHINNLAPGKVPSDYRVLLPGYSDQLAFDLGLLDTDVSFEETRRRAHINPLAHRFRDDPDFSVKIRQR
ncbi:MAG: DUF4105 domain-containing protein [Pirellulaceae bacterium]